MPESNNKPEADKWKILYENIQDSIMIVGQDYLIKEINRIQQGFRREDVIGVSMFSFVSHLKADFLKREVALILSGEKTSVEVEDIIYGPDGMPNWYYSVYSPIVQPDGSIDSFMIISRNITTQKQAEINYMSAIFDGQEQERQRLSEELHDGVSQQLMATILSLKTLPDETSATENPRLISGLNTTSNLLSNIATELNTIMHGQDTRTLDKYGLATAIENYCTRMGAAYKQEITVKVAADCDNLPPKLELAAYRIVQELVSNMLKHANATVHAIAVDKIDDSLQIVATDNGTGFNTDNESKGLGLKNIKSRAAVWQGIVEINSGEGTEVKVLLKI